jgi:ubiquinone/menaquinone biosynthesis C-methylase UbiE
VRYFDAASAYYGTPAAIEIWQQKYIDRLFAHLTKPEGRLFVDNACGSGYMSIEAAKRGMVVLACDLNMIGLLKLQAHAKRLGLSHLITPICCSSEDLPVKTSCAEAVVANAILEHLPREKDAIGGMVRIAKPGALIMITVPLAYHLLNPIFLFINYFHDRQIGHLRRYTFEMLKTRFPKFNFKGVYYTGHTLKVFKTLFNILMHVFDEERIEKDDEKHIHNKLFASNISVLLQKARS